MDESAANSANSGSAPAAPDGAAAPAAVPAPPPLPARTIGERLRAARERSGLSIPAAAEKLHLDTKVIEALEADRFAEIGASVYVRGHLKRYADFVGEPGADMVAQYAAREARAPAPDLTQVPHPERRSDPSRLLKPLAVLGAAAVLLAAIWWVLAGSGPRTPVASSEPVSSPPAVAPSALPAAEPVPASLAVSAPVTAPAADAPVATAPAAGTPAVTKEPPAREVRLRLELTNDSWVEVYDAQGERLFYDVATAGSVQSVSGRAPLRVVLGNSAGVAVDVDGQRRDIPAGAADGEGARFVVNRSGSLSRAR